MALRQFGAASAVCHPALDARSRGDQIQWWRDDRSNNDVISQARQRFQRLAKRLQNRRPSRAATPRYVERWDRGVPRRQCPGIMQVFSRTATMMAAKGAVKPVSELMKAGREIRSEILSTRDHGIRRQGRDAVVPVFNSSAWS
jgi:sn-glycerol 3-phosphate transport system substrate-binding protein